MKKFLVLTAAMIVAAGLSSGAVVTYTNSANWSAAVGGVFNTFTFTGNFNSTPAGATINITQSAANNYNGNPSYSGIFNNLYRDAVTSGQMPNGGSTAVTSSTYSMTSPGNPALYAVGGLWDTSPDNEGGGLNILLNLSGGGTAVVGTIGPINGFFGWVSDTPFTSFVISTNNNLTDAFGRPFGVEAYTVDNLQVAAVPEPATFSIVGLALLGLGAFKRYRRS